MRRRKTSKQMRRWMRRHRLTRQLTAFAGGYFWLPCLRCGEHSGGHEWEARFCLVQEQQFDDQGRLSFQRSTGLCPACELEMGEMGAELCRQTGHRWIGTWSSRRSDRRDLGDGQYETSVHMSGPPTEVYCKQCGIDGTLRQLAEQTR